MKQGWIHTSFHSRDSLLGPLLLNDTGSRVASGGRCRSAAGGWRGVVVGGFGDPSILRGRTQTQYIRAGFYPVLRQQRVVVRREINEIPWIQFVEVAPRALAVE